MEKPTIVDFDAYRGEWVALDPTTEAILAHSRSFIEVEQQAIARGIDPVMEFVPETDGYFAGWL